VKEGICHEYSQENFQDVQGNGATEKEHGSFSTAVLKEEEQQKSDQAIFQAPAVASSPHAEPLFFTLSQNLPTRFILISSRVMLSG
jgi:hypothetical protein